MSHVVRRPTRRPGHATAIAAVFFANGTVFASWIPRIPEVQASLGLSNPALGLVLAAGGAGGLAGTVASPGLVSRLGARPVAVVAGALVAVAFCGVPVAPNGAALAAVLLVAATADALTDIAMNDLGVQTQHRTGRSLMNRLHAGWSLGALTGAVTSSAVAAAGVPLGVHLATLAAVLVVGLAIAWRYLPTDRSPPRPVVSRRAVASVAGVLMPLAFAAALVEAIPADWSAVFLATAHDLGPGAVGLAFTAFAGAMLAGRLAGDAVTEAVGAAGTARVATGLTAVGLGTVVAGPAAAVAIGGFALLGLGTSVLFPLIYGAAGNLSAVASGTGLALMSIGARIGFLSSGPLVGALSDVVGLRMAIGVLLAAALATVMWSRVRLEPHLA